MIFYSEFLFFTHTSSLCADFCQCLWDQTQWICRVKDPFLQMLSLSLYPQICVHIWKALEFFLWNIKSVLGRYMYKGLKILMWKFKCEIGKSQLKIQTWSRNSISWIEYINKVAKIIWLSVFNTLKQINILLETDFVSNLCFKRLKYMKIKSYFNTF